MLVTSNEYKSIMQRPIRNKSHVKITYGLSTADDGNLRTEGFPKNDFMYGGEFPLAARGAIYKCAVNYAYLCEDSMRTNGTQIILPKNSANLRDNGFIPNSFSGEYGTILYGVLGYALDKNCLMAITGKTGFTEPFKTNGFSISFDKTNNTYPKSIKVVGYIKEGNDWVVKTDRHFENDSHDFTYTEIYDGELSFYYVYFAQLNKPKTYLRITGLTMGASHIFSNDDITHCRLEKSIDFLSNSLSYQEFKFTVNNFDKHYNPINPIGIYREFDTNHTLNVEFGLELDSGDIEWLQVANLITTGKPTFDGYTYTIKATDKLSQMTYLNYYTLDPRHLRENNYNWYQWLETTVNKTLGKITMNDIVIDDDIDLTSPALLCTPLIPMNESLQLFANLHCSVLFTDNTGKLRIKNAWIPRIKIYDNGHLDYSDINAVVNSITLPTFSYATLQPDYMETLDPIRQIILPNSVSDITEDRGYISSHIADVVGNFEINPKITIEYSLPITENGIHIIFNNVDNEYATEFDVVYYKENDVLAYTHSVTNNETYDYSASVEQSDIVKVELIIKKWSHKHHRPVVNRIGTGRVENVYIDFNSILSDPKINLTGEVNEIRSMYHWKEKDNDLGNKSIGHVVYDEIGTYWFSVKDEYYALFSINSSGTYNVDVTNPYALRVNVTESPCDIEFYGMILKKDDVQEIVEFNDKGEVYAIDNPLCADRDTAIKLANWYYDYIKKGAEISFDYRGSPELEPFDFIYIQTHYEDRVPICITRTVLNYDGALSGEIEGVKI